MTEIEAQQLVTMLALAFPDGWRFLDEQQQDDTQALYRRMILDLDYIDVDRAIVRLIATCKKMPAIADIRAATVAVTAGREHTGGEAWGALREMIEANGERRHPEIGDPVLARCVDAMGWRRLCLSSDHMADRSQFIRLYDELSAQQREDLAVGQIAAPIPRRQLGAGPRRVGDMLGGLMPKMLKP